jgi:hypothetical protein
LGKQRCPETSWGVGEWEKRKDYLRKAKETFLL